MVRAPRERSRSCLTDRALRAGCSGGAVPVSPTLDTKGPPLDAETVIHYRRALGCFATGVVVVTVHDAEGSVALVVNSFTSVSLEPPLVLFCLGDKSDRGAYFREAERYVINIMGVEGEPLAARYAARGRHRIEPDDVEALPSGLPGLRGALTRLECRAHQRLPIADHLAIVGEVERFETRDGDGLTYFRGRYGAAPTPASEGPHT